MQVFNRFYATISLRNLYFNIIMVNSPFSLKNISDRVGILTKILSKNYSGTITKCIHKLIRMSFSWY